MFDLNTGLIGLLGVVHAGNLYWFKCWKSDVDKTMVDLHTKLDGQTERIARIEGFLNGKSKE